MKRSKAKPPKVFISHASDDEWVARQLAFHIHKAGAQTFLDCEQIEAGDDFEDAIIEHAGSCTEMLVLFTPTAKTRRYVWMEIGMFLGARKRIVAVLYGVTEEEISTDRRIPVALKRLHAIRLNDIDGYFEKLTQRLKKQRDKNA